MKTSVSGFPRIGIKRELKKAEEAYFAGKINADELVKKASELRAIHWKIQNDARICFISSNDFSLYDGMLDTSVMLGLIPSRFSDAGLSNLDTYFACARGYQKGTIDLKPLPMKKWFTTNYHYIVPEISDDAQCAVYTEKLFSEWEQAEALGLSTVPSIIGPYTFLTKAHYTGKKNEKDFAHDCAASYKKIVELCFEKGIEWVRFDESALCEDLDKEQITLFSSLYTDILSSKKRSKVILKTSFGDIRDVYNKVIDLGFDGIGLDFVEGKESVNLIASYGFPKNTVLFAGLINGKNIWKNNYEQTLSVLSDLKKHTDTIVLSTASSLLFVPYTVEDEKSEELQTYFSFAVEKLQELNELSFLADNLFYKDHDLYKRNVQCMRSKKTYTEDYYGKIKKLLTRNLNRRERAILQKGEFDFPLLPTTTIGSFPQSFEVRKNRSEYKKGLKTKEDYNKTIFSFIKDCISVQEKLGLDVLVHGEYERNDMAEYFGENLDGFIITQNGWVQSYGSRCVKPPIIFSDISRKKDFTVPYIVYAQSLTKKPVKGMLTGPVTIVNWSFPREDISPKESAYQIAGALREEVLSLEKNGIRIIQIDEAALKERLPIRKKDWYENYLSWAIDSFRYCCSGVQETTQIHTHMCYSEFSRIIESIDRMDADVITFEASRSGLDILKPLKDSNFETQCGPGVYDIHSSRIPSVSEIETCIDGILSVLPIKKVWINPDCGLKTRTDLEAVSALENMMGAVQKKRRVLNKK